MYDVIIIGAGPAGFTAAIYASRRGLKTLIISKETGGQLIWASVIENYPSFISISSHDLISKFEDQVKNLEVEIKNDEANNIVKLDNNNFKIKTNNDEFEAKAIILCLGLVPRKLEVKGEDKFRGRGVAYCSTCDGPLFKNKIVAVIGGGNSALDSAENLSRIANKVYLIQDLRELTGFEYLKNKIKNNKNIEIIYNAKVKEITGEKRVEKIIIDADNNLKELLVNGIFIEIGRIPNINIIADKIKLNENNQIIIDSNGSTNIKGIFAAGDVTNSPYKQITIACGQGTIAALSAYNYLQKKNI